MNIVTRRTALVAGAVGLLSGAISSPVLADVRDYEFQLLQNEAKKGDGTIVTVRLLNINDPFRVELRRELIEDGAFPAD